jgi:hypothetical protein
MTTNQLDSSLNPLAISKFFSSSILNQLSKNGRSKSLGKLIIESKLDQICGADENLAACFDLAFSYLQKSYRNEYIYKNTIANKILLGRHSLKTASMLTEFRVGDSKADVLILNGTAHIYEIKTELDSLDRISGQLSDYVKFADYVTVVTSKKHVDKLVERIPMEIGILVLTDEGRLRSIRKPISCKDQLDRSLIFSSLQQIEYTEIVRRLTGTVPKVSNGFIYTECKSIFEEIDIDISYKLVVDILKQRNMDDKVREFIQLVPFSLKAMATSMKLTNSQRFNLLTALNRNLSSYIY